MRTRRGLSSGAVPESLRGVADGPGKLCQALGIAMSENGLDLAESDALFFEEGDHVPEDRIIAGRG